MADLHEASFYSKAADGAVDCFLCNHRCHIPDGKLGFCRVRRNRGGTLYSLVYGRLISNAVDPIEKKPLYHFLPGTGSFSIATPGCNFRCRFCQNYSISQTSGERLAGLAQVAPERVVEAARRTKTATIAYTYTEPTIFMEYALDCAALAHEQGIRNVFVTNGFESPEAVEAMTGLIDAANVDVKAFNDAFYRRLCKARLQPVLDTVRRMHEQGILVEVTTLLIPGQNDDEAELKALARFLVDVSPDVPWHISRYHPDYQCHEPPPTPPEAVFRAVEIGLDAGLRFVYAGNLRAGEYENTRCPSCQATVVRRTGFLVQEIKLSAGRCGACGAELPIATADDA